MKKQQESKKVKKVFEIDAIQIMKNVTQPQISKQRKQELRQKLDIEKAAQSKVAQRIKKGNLMLTYERNPFTEKVDKIIQPLSTLANAQTVITKVNDLTQKKLRDEFKRMKQDFNHEQQNTILLSKKINTNITKINYQNHFKVYNQQEKVHKQIINQDILQTLPKKLSQIKKISEQNYLFKKPNKFNVLKAARNFYHTENIQNTFLEDHHFVENSVIDSFSADRKLFIYRQMSKMARLLVCNKQIKENILDYLDSYQLSFNVKDVGYKDLMNVASGRFKADFLFKYLYQVEQQMDDKISFSMTEKQVPVTKNLENEKGIMTDQIDIERFQIEQLKKSPYEEHEVNHKKKLNYIIQQIQKQTTQKVNILKYGINDKTVHKIRANNIDKKLEKFSVQKIENDELIRYIGVMKRNKNKEEMLMYSALKEAIKKTVQKKKQEQQVRKVSLMLN